MDTKWLEDFVVLAEVRSFSKAAQLRHITQPAFSRRIQALEAWLGLDLINRSAYPPSLTSAGESFYAHAQDLLNRIGSLRADVGETPSASKEVIGFALPHSLSLSFFPRWLAQVQVRLQTNARSTALISRARVGNVLDVVLWLVEGGCDLLICFHHPQQPVQLDPERYDTLRIGTELLAPYSATGSDGKAVHELPGKSQRQVPLLAYSSSAYLGRMADLAMAAGRSRLHLRRVFETDMAESLKEMAIAGHGIAFLPESTAADAVATGCLARLSGGWEVEMQIRAYRERPSLSRPAAQCVERIWALLEQDASRFTDLAERSGPKAQVERLPTDRRRVRGSESSPSRTRRANHTQEIL
jgi:DNA-binding transcriptional LysR family regulator